jgi:hypothetical protein
MAEFAVAHPDITRSWRLDSNFLVVVAVPNEAQLFMLESVALTFGIKHTLVIEPDYGDQATAIALEPVPMSRKLCAQFPLALKEKGRERSGASAPRLCDVIGPSTQYGTAEKESVS